MKFTFKSFILPFAVLMGSAQGMQQVSNLAKAGWDKCTLENAKTVTAYGAAPVATTLGLRYFLPEYTKTNVALGALVLGAEMAYTGKLSELAQAGWEKCTLENGKTVAKVGLTTAKYGTLPLLTKLVSSYYLPEHTKTNWTLGALVLGAELAYSKFKSVTLSEFNDVLGKNDVTAEELVNAFNGLSKKDQANDFAKNRFAGKYKALTGQEYKPGVEAPKSDEKKELSELEKKEQELANLKAAGLVKDAKEQATKVLDAKISDLNKQLAEIKDTGADSIKAKNTIKTEVEVFDSFKAQVKDAQTVDAVVALMKKAIPQSWKEWALENKWKTGATVGGALITGFVAQDMIRNGIKGSNTAAMLSWIYGKMPNISERMPETNIKENAKNYWNYTVDTVKSYMPVKASTYNNLQDELNASNDRVNLFKTWFENASSELGKQERRNGQLVDQVLNLGLELDTAKNVGTEVLKNIGQ